MPLFILVDLLKFFFVSFRDCVCHVRALGRQRDRPLLPVLYRVRFLLSWVIQSSSSYVSLCRYEYVRSGGLGDTFYDIDNDFQLVKVTMSAVWMVPCKLHVLLDDDVALNCIKSCS